MIKSQNIKRFLPPCQPWVIGKIKKSFRINFLFPLGQNVSPGGQAGVEMFHRSRIFKTSNLDEITDDEYELAQDKLLNVVSSDNGLNSVFEKERNFTEMSDETKTELVCNNPNNLTVEQVKFIKIMIIAGHSEMEIYKRCRKDFHVSYIQIESLYNGKTYRFVA